MYFTKFEEFSAIISLIFFSPLCLLWGSRNTYVVSVDGAPQSLSLFTFLPYCFFFLSLRLILSIVLISDLLILSSAYSILPLHSSNEFSFQLLYFSAPEFHFIFTFLISLMMFPFCSCIISLTFSTSFFNSLVIFKTVVLKSLPSRSAYLAFFSGTVSIDRFTYFFFFFS